MHPNIVATICHSIVIPKMLYGLELTSTSKSFIEKVDRQCRCAFKQLLGLSKHCSNDLNKLFNLHSITYDIINRKINLIQLLMKNQTTSKYVITLLTSSYEERKFSVIQEIFDLCLQENLDVFNILINRKFEKLYPTSALDIANKQFLQESLKNWHIYENRMNLKKHLETNIPTKI